MKQRTLWISGAVLLLLGAGALWYAWKRNGDEAPKWRTAAVERGDIQVSVTATGTLQAVTTVLVGTQVSGPIASLHADFNSEVKKGQIIARLDSTLLLAALSDARSNLSRVDAQHQQAAVELKRTQALFDRSLVSQAELDQARANAEVATANLNSVKSQVERARINLRYAVITSPIDGIVLSRAVDVGQTVAASFNTPTLFTIAGDLREMRVQAAVDEADIGKVRNGQKAEFTVDAYPDTVFHGEVEQVRLQPKTEQNVVTYDVVLKVPNPDLRLMPGMTANLVIAVSRKESVLRVPAAALRFRPPRDPKSDTAGVRGEWRARRDAAEGQAATNPHGGDGSARGDGRASGARSRGNGGSSGRVFVLEEGKPKPVRVRIGLSDGAKTEVEGPLESGTQVIIGVDSAGARPAGSPFGLSTPSRRRR
jgi:HlyD family secretion protein